MRVLKLFLEGLFKKSTVDYSLVSRLNDSLDTGKAVNLRDGKKAVFKDGRLTVACQKTLFRSHFTKKSIFQRVMR